MKKLSSFKYKGMIFHNTKDSLFQTDRFGDKLVYKKIGYEFATMKRQIKTMQNIITEFETRAKHAESNYCSVTECELRIPKRGVSLG